jgi:MarR family 2-MHQ and catechol resistance regulon transcriptional repressor
MSDWLNLPDPRLASFNRLVEACALLEQRLGQEMEASLGLPLRWYSVLLYLGRVAGGLCPTSELIAATAFTSGGVTRLVDRMEQAGYVERRPCPRDKRVTYVGLTEEGRALLARATSVHLDGIQRHLMDVLGLDNVLLLDALLTKLAAANAQPAALCSTPPATR